VEASVKAIRALTEGENPIVLRGIMVDRAILLQQARINGQWMLEPWLKTSDIIPYEPDTAGHRLLCNALLDALSAEQHEALRIGEEVQVLQSDVQQWAWDAIDSGGVCAIALPASARSMPEPLPPGMPRAKWLYCWALNSLEPERGVDAPRYIRLAVQETAQPTPEQAQPTLPVQETAQPAHSVQEAAQQKPTTRALTAIGLAHAWIAENGPTDEHGRARTDREVLREALTEAAELRLLDDKAFSPDSSSLRAYTRAMIAWEIKLQAARRGGR
jgi:hypothetical protein